MFSPSITEGVQTRSRRRRQRPKSTDDLAPPPKAKRQRLPLTEQTFVNPEVAPEMFEVKSDRIPRIDFKRDEIENLAVPKKEPSARAKKVKAAERAGKGDGSVILSTSNAYTVSKLPALPDRIRADAIAAQHGDIFSSTGFALSLTHTHAVVWPYTSTTPSPETFTFALPYPSKNASEPLPLGCLVSPSASSTEPGLVVVMPVSGKITYWESISSAATIDFIRQQRHGVEDSIHGMSSGERVIQIASAETAGFILAFTTGRLALMNVRDSHGRPSVSVQFLSSGLAPAHSGIFGSIRHVLSHSTGRGEIAAVRAERTASVGERNVVAATVKGKLLAWRFHRGGHHDKLAEVDMRDELVRAIRDVDPSTLDYPQDSFELLDFTYVPKGLDPKYFEMSRLSDAIASNDSSIQHVVILTSLTKRYVSRYCLVEAILSPKSCLIGMVQPISSYSSPLDAKTHAHSVRPRVHLPRPALVAFTVFEKAVVVTSIAVPPQSPDSQLQEDNHMAPATFEDVVDLRDDNSLEIVGSGFEEPLPPTSGTDTTSAHRYKAKNPTAVIIVRGAGVLRISTTDVDRFASDKAPKLTAKGKLEQAVFFGAKADNPLLFDGRRDSQFSHRDLAAAAVELSHEILSSTSPHIGTLPVSLGDNLAGRSASLHRLMQHLQATGVELDRRTRWALLWNAEKMVVASLLWKRQEEFVSERGSGDKKTLIAEIVEFIHEDQKTDPNRAIGEVDRVRHWFLNDVWRLEIFIAWAYEVIKYMYKDKILDDARLTTLIAEAVAVNIISITSALEFRHANLDFYGLGAEGIQHGILESYDGLPEPWTGSQFVSNNIKRLVELCHTWLLQYHPPKGNPPGTRPNVALVERITAEMPLLTDLYLLSLLEQSRWARSSQDPKVVQWGGQCYQQYKSDRYEKTIALEALEQWDQAETIAEKHECWAGLADILIVHILALRTKADDSRISPADSGQLVGLALKKEAKIQDYFDKYGRSFAFATYDKLLDRSGVQGVLDFGGDTYGYKTQYLRTKPDLARISWINDVEGERDIDHAAETLLDLGFAREQQVWNKKIELSLGKLALMAEGPETQFSLRAETVESAEQKLERVDKELRVIKIQESLYSQVFPTVRNALDESAELDLALENHGARIPKKHKVLFQIFEDGMGQLLRHEALDALTLIDLLTLTWFKENSGFSQFYLALAVADSVLTGDQLAKSRRLIWRRCFLADDWSKINNTDLKHDMEVLGIISSTHFFQTAVVCYTNHQGTEEHFRPIRPSEAIGVYTDMTDRRFTDMEKSFQDKLTAAMKWEDSVLKTYMDKHRLEQWAENASQEAKETVTELVDEATRAGAEGNGREVEVDGLAKTNGKIA